MNIAKWKNLDKLFGGGIYLFIHLPALVIKPLLLAKALFGKKAQFFLKFMSNCCGHNQFAISGEGFFLSSTILISDSKL